MDVVFSQSILLLLPHVLLDNEKHHLGKVNQLVEEELVVDHFGGSGGQAKESNTKRGKTNKKVQKYHRGQKLKKKLLEFIRGFHNFPFPYSLWGDESL